MANKNADAAVARDVATYEELDATDEDPTVRHHIDALRLEAKTSKKTQRKILSAWDLEGKTGSRELVVKPNGSYSIEEK